MAKLEFELCKRILDTLPVSYYLKHPINVELKLDSETSYYDPITQNIVVSYFQLLNIDYNENTTYEEFENDIRCMLYHEISHAILTAKSSVDSYYFREYHDIINIFEDQRIETILHNYYMRVDFKGFVKRICNYKPFETPKSALDLFFRIVRFQEYTNDTEKTFVEKVNDLITKYAPLNSMSDFNVFNWYAQDVYYLYEEIERYFNQNQNAQNQPNQQMSSNSQMNGNGSGNGMSVNGSNESQNQSNENGTENEDQNEELTENEDQEDNANTQNGKNCSDSNANDNANGNEKGNGSDTTENVENSQDTPPTDLLEELLQNKDFQEFLQNVINNALSEMFKYDNDKFANKIERILFSRTKENGNAYGCTSAYSGRIDSRLYGTNREPYKWCVRDGGTQIAKAKPLRLNLYIDNSDSFENNEDIVNSMLQELTKLEKIKNDFEFTFTTINHRVVPHAKNDRILKCGGGTRLQDNIIDIFNKNQDINYTTYNVVLFDGECKNSHLFKTFNTNNTILISDYDNKQAIERWCGKARKRVFTYNYTDKLIDNVIECLECLIR